MLQEAPLAPRMAARWLHNGPKRAQEGPKRHQDGAKVNPLSDREFVVASSGNVRTGCVPQMAPRWLQDGPTMAPRWLQDDPKRDQDGPKRPQDGPKVNPLSDREFAVVSSGIARTGCPLPR